MNKKKKGKKNQVEGVSPSPGKSNLKSIAESDSLLNDSELDDILMQSQIDPSLLGGPSIIGQNLNSPDKKSKFNILNYSQNAKTTDFNGKKPA